MIPIYTVERELGLADTIAKSCVIAYTSPVVTGNQESLSKYIKFDSDAFKLAKTFASANNFDLYTAYTILVTVGWNKNDDVFDRYEVFIARDTPEDKPFNFEHIPSKIIGHITGSHIVDDSLNIIASDTKFEDLPKKFHILTSSVIYKHLNSREPELQEAAAQLIQEIEAGQWCVSMEALFSDFDYGLTSTSGDQKIITRCEGTAFLTKYLRIYGGNGVYNNCKIGRVLKNITFSGKGLVKNPANPESIIINDVQQFAGVVANINTLENEVNNDMEKELQDKIANLEAQLAAATKTIEELSAKQSQAQIEAKDAEITKLNDGLVAANTQVTTLSKQVEEITASKAELQKSLEEAQAKLEEANKQLATIAEQAKVTARVSAFVDAGVERVAAEEMVKKFAALDDEMFAQIVAMQAELAAEKKKDKKKEEGMPGGCKAGEDATVDPAGQAAAAAVNVDNVVPEVEPTMAVSTENADKELIQGIAQYLAQEINNKSGK